MSFHFPSLPAPAEQIRVDGWSPQRQRQFLETLAATGVIATACDAVNISPRAAYTLRIRRDGAAFRLGWDAAILIARARLADDLLARALTGSEEVIRKDVEAGEITRHRHDNRLAMSMLARLDRMADNPPQGSDAALARVVAQDFVAYLDLLCPPDDRPAPTPTDTHEATASETELAEPELADAPFPATALSPGASAALFVAARMALGDPGKAHPYERCELRPLPPSPHVDLATLPPEEAATRLRGIWWDEDRQGWRTDYPAPPDFDGEESDDIYDIDAYERTLTAQEEAALALRDAAERRPYEDAAARARDLFFGFAALEDAA
jgi:hypothetical protein